MNKRKKKLKKIKSIYFPPNALQGEDIPGHITWDEKFFDIIQIELPKNIKLNEMYNVKPIDYYSQYRKITIKNCEYNNYIGFLFSTFRTKSNETNEIIKIKFIKNNENVLAIEKNIKLFRPNLEVQSIPDLIKIDSNDTLNKIKIRNNGKATVLINFVSDETSEIEISEPTKIKTIRDSINSKLEIKLKQLKEDYPNYSQLIDDFWEYHISSDWNLGNKVVKELNAIINSNEKFLKDLLTSIAYSIIESMELETMVENFLTYFNSIPVNNILLYNPIDVINYSTKHAKLNFEIISEDLLRENFDPISLSTDIVGNEDGYLEIYKLFSFEEA
jgi:hypothetical protein